MSVSGDARCGVRIEDSQRNPRPFNVGDYITAGGATGTVRELGLFFTKITTPDNVDTILGNNAIFSGTIPNFSTVNTSCPVTSGGNRYPSRAV